MIFFGSGVPIATNVAAILSDMQRTNDETRQSNLNSNEEQGEQPGQEEVSEAERMPITIGPLMGVISTVYRDQDQLNNPSNSQPRLFYEFLGYHTSLGPSSNRYPVQGIEESLSEASNLSAARYVDETHARALSESAKEGAFVKGVIKAYLASMPEASQNKAEESRSDFQKKLDERDPEVFIRIPKECLKTILASTEPLTEENVPKFFVPYLEDLQSLQKAHQTKSDKIATALVRDPSFIAAMQIAMGQ